MRIQALRSILMGLLLVPAVLVSITSESGASRTKLDALVGKRVPAAPSSWYPIAKVPMTATRHYYPLPRSVVELFTTGIEASEFPSVQFLLFRSNAAARAYYLHPGINLAADAASQQSLAGPRPAPSPSRWIDLQQCIYESGPNPHAAPQGAPASLMTSSGKCPIGTPTSVGLGTIALRGPVVVIVNNPAGVPYVSPIPVSVTTFPTLAVLGAAALSANASKLLRSSGGA